MYIHVYTMVYSKRYDIQAMNLYLQLILTAVIVAGYCSAQAPEDGDERCTGAEDAPTYPDAVKNLMDSYNYVQLLPGSGTGNPPIEGAVWTDRSVDDNNTIDTTSPTYVSL